MNFLQSKLFAALLGSLTFMLTTAFLTTKGITPLPLSAQESGHGQVGNITGPSWEFFNPELDQLISELKAEREAVAAKEKELNELGARLRAERGELNEALSNVQRLRQQVDRDVYRIKEDESGNLKKLAKMYSAMEPAGAAKILRELDDVVVVKVLTLMKEAESALIIEAFARLGEAETKRAAALLENLRAATAAKPTAKP